MRKLTVLSALVLLLAGVAGCDEEFYQGDGGRGSDSSIPSFEGGSGVKTPTCPGQESTISGTVYAPNGSDPVPGATVFIPGQVPELFPPEVACEVCGHLGGSNNLWQTVSAHDGTFELRGVCPGARPVVFQNGRFRRLVDVQVVASTPLQLSADKTRLPRRKGEFHLADAVPRIAVATGDFDKMECVLKKMGLEPGPDFKLFEGSLSRTSPAGLPPFTDLVRDLAQMKTYNVIFINCTADTFEEELQKPAVLQNLREYANAGGRLYVTDWSYDWIEQVADFAPFIDFEPGPSGAQPEPINAAALGAPGLEVMASIKDPQMASWLGLFPGAIQGGQSRIEHFLVDWVIMHALGDETKLWVDGDISSDLGDINGVRPLTVTFNFKNCGKILFSSYHTEGREDEGLFPLPFPQYCGAGFSPQDRVLEYLIFDIASCIKPIE